MRSHAFVCRLFEVDEEWLAIRAYANGHVEQGLPRTLTPSHCCIHLRSLRNSHDIQQADILREILLCSSFGKQQGCNGACDALARLLVNRIGCNSLQACTSAFHLFKVNHTKSV